MPLLRVFCDNKTPKRAEPGETCRQVGEVSRFNILTRMTRKERTGLCRRSC